MKFSLYPNEDHSLILYTFLKEADEIWMQTDDEGL